jgi:hypothetical protein
MERRSLGPRQTSKLPALVELVMSKPLVSTGMVAKAIDVTFIGLDLTALIIGVFASLQITGEYSSRLIRTSLLAVARRWPLLLAKALVYAVTTVAVMGPAVLVSFLASQALIGTHGATLSDPGAVRAVLGATAYTVAMGLMGIGIGAAVRHTAVSITAFVAVLLILPAMLGPALPDAVERRVLPYVPVAAAQSVYAQLPDAGPFTLLSPAVGLLVLAGWVTGLLLAGVAVLNHRDA